ncbi:Uncharacterised protein [Rikenella microfusus]|uniref:Uncharacterized protein n=1 Tax=Rikenella microfusus TaxID=28139 RepID=A0A379MR65_9BACT|nr:Uncharacterised protein [Rikenella microfusus]
MFRFRGETVKRIAPQCFGSRTTIKKMIIFIKTADS